jgi:uncharacterized membrane protein
VNKKRYKILRVIVAIFVFAVAAVAVISDSYLLAIAGILAGMIFIILALSKAKIKTDERGATVQEKATRITFTIFAPTIGIAAFLLLFPSQSGLSVFSKEKNMSKTRSDNLSIQPVPSLLKRWTRGMGYAACAWGLLFTLEHVYWICGGRWLLGKTIAQSLESLYAYNPWSYVFFTGLIIALFAILALFPLALTWQEKHVSQRNMQWIAIIFGYMGMILMAAYCFAIQEILQGLICLGVCILGIGVAFVRPRGQSAVRWQVVVVTWIFGSGMTIYGCTYIVIALLNIHSALFMHYLVAGGMNWTIEGVLFVTVAWLVSFSKRVTSP